MFSVTFFSSKLRVVEFHWFDANCHCMHTDLRNIICNADSDSLEMGETGLGPSWKLLHVLNKAQFFTFPILAMFSSFGPKILETSFSFILASMCLAHGPCIHSPSSFDSWTCGILYAQWILGSINTEKTTIGTPEPGTSTHCFGLVFKDAVLPDPNFPIGVGFLCYPKLNALLNMKLFFFSIGCGSISDPNYTLNTSVSWSMSLCKTTFLKAFASWGSADQLGHFLCLA